MHKEVEKNKEFVLKKAPNSLIQCSARCNKVVTAAQVIGKNDTQELFGNFC